MFGVINGSVTRSESPRVSVAVPLFNEEKTLPELLARLRRVLDGLSGGPHEMVFVDDGSSDRSFEVLREVAASDPTPRWLNRGLYAVSRIEKIFRGIPLLFGSSLLAVAGKPARPGA
jgi:glycosyltransferase involved in cell wall biosynthesis